jgi:DNA-binding Xre family transcriptional regulator
MKFLFQLDKILKEKNMSVRSFSVLAKIHYRTALNIYHNNTAGVSLEVLSKICTALDVKLEEVIKAKK